MPELNIAPHNIHQHLICFHICDPTREKSTRIILASGSKEVETAQYKWPHLSSMGNKFVSATSLLNFFIATSGIERNFTKCISENTQNIDVNIFFN